MSQQLPPELQKKIKDFQMLQTNLQTYMEQKLRLEAQLREMESATDYMGTMGADEPIYKSVGGFMVLSSKDRAIEDLEDQKIKVNSKIKNLTISIEKMQARYEELKKALQSRMG